MKWFKSRVDLARHSKRFRFEELLCEDRGLHYLFLWFCHVCEFAPNGDVSNFRPIDVARACEWRGEPQKIWDALLGSGFIEKTKTGFRSHDWIEENGYFLRESMRLRALKKDASRTRAKRVPHAKVTRLDKIRLEDNTEQEKDQKTKPPSASKLPAKHPAQDAFWDLAKQTWDTKHPGPLAWPALKWFPKKLFDALEIFGPVTLAGYWANMVRDEFFSADLGALVSNPSKYAAPPRKKESGKKSTYHSPPLVDF